MILTKRNELEKIQIPTDTKVYFHKSKQQPQRNRVRDIHAFMIFIPRINKIQTTSSFPEY